MAQDSSFNVQPELFLNKDQKTPLKSLGEFSGSETPLAFDNFLLTAEEFRKDIVRINLSQTGAMHGSGVVKPKPIAMKYQTNKHTWEGAENSIQVDPENGRWAWQREGHVIECDQGYYIGECKTVSTATLASVNVFLKYSSNARVFGLGEKTGWLNKRGEDWEMWNSDVFAPHTPDQKSLYQSIPFAIIQEGERYWGVFLDNTGRTVFDFKPRDGGFLLSADGGDLDCYLFAGPSLADVVEQYTSLTGRPYLPPRWAMGYHQSRHSYETEDEVLAVVEKFSSEKIGLDAIHLDIRYMDGYRVFSFDPDRFANANNVIGLLRAQGVDVVPIVDPGIKLDMHYRTYKNALELDYLVRDEKDSVFVGTVWPGDSVFPDFSKKAVRDWWGKQHQFYTDMGVRGIWNDMNEPAVFEQDNFTMPAGNIFATDDHPVTHDQYHNLYGYQMSAATFHGMQSLLNERPFVVTRAGYAGVQSVATVWTGDNRSFWEHLQLCVPMCLNLSLSGVAHCGPDIGGFMNDSNGELLTRWMQMGAFLPYMRNHCAIGQHAQEPWAFGRPWTHHIKAAIDLRYQILPYIYDLAWQANKTGIPIIRPLFWHYPTDDTAQDLNDQFLLGESVMVAPIIQPGQRARAVYLPEDNWFDFHSGERFSSGWQLVECGLNNIPVLVKEGAVLPLNMNAINSKNQGGVLQLKAFCNPQDFMLDVYDDNGSQLQPEQPIQFEYKNGQLSMSGHCQSWQAFDVTFVG